MISKQSVVAVAALAAVGQAADSYSKVTFTEYEACETVCKSTKSSYDPALTPLFERAIKRKEERTDSNLFVFPQLAKRLREVGALVARQL